MSAPKLSPQDLDDLRELGRTIYTSRVALVVGIGIFASDYFHTFVREVQFYWSGSLSIPRFLYFIIRYANALIQILNLIGFFAAPSITFCKGYTNVQIGLDLILIWAVQAILVFRIRAIYGRAIIGTILWSLLSLVILSEGTLGVLGVNLNPHWSAEPLPGLHFCTPLNPHFLQRTHYLTWIPTLVFDSVIFFLSLMKFIELRSLTTPGVFKKSLTWTLLHDSIVYYALLLVMALVYMIVTRINVENGESASNIIFPIISAAGCRLLFHIRSKERQQVLGMNSTMRGNGAHIFSEDLMTSRPIEFQVFSRKDRTTQDGGNLEDVGLEHENENEGEHRGVLDDLEDVELGMETEGTVGRISEQDERLEEHSNSGAVSV